MLRLACLEIQVDARTRFFPRVEPPFAPTAYVAEVIGFDDTDRVAHALVNLVTLSSIP